MIEKYFKGQVCVIVPALVGKLYPTNAPPKTPLPYGVYSCVGSTEDGTLTGDNTLFSETIQLDIYTSTYKEAKGYFDTLKTVLLDYRGNLDGYPVKRVKVVSASDGYEPEVLEQKTTLEFEIYY